MKQRRLKFGQYIDVEYGLSAASEIRLSNLSAALQSVPEAVPYSSSMSMNLPFNNAAYTQAPKRKFRTWNKGQKRSKLALGITEQDLGVLPSGFKGTDQYSFQFSSVSAIDRTRGMARGVADKTKSLFARVKGIFSSPANFLSGVGRAAKATYKFATGPKVLGLGGYSKSILGKMAIPGILLGAYGAYNAASNLLGGGYSLDNPATAWGHTPGAYTPYENTPMNFSMLNRTGLEMDATGSMAFALHNMRKR